MACNGSNGMAATFGSTGIGGVVGASSVSPLPHVINGQTGGHFSLGFKTGVIVGALTAPNEIVQIRWQDTKMRLIPLRISLSVCCSAFSSGTSLDFALYVARSWSVNGTGGTQITAPTKTNSSAMAASIFQSNGDLRVASTTELTAGTKTLDANPIGTGWAQIKAIWDVTTIDLYTVTDFGQSPVALGNNEGLAIRLETKDLAASNSIMVRGRFEWVETAGVPF